MLTCNAEEVQESLLKAKTEIQRKLENMVAGFASDLARGISEGTPTGNAGDLAEGLASGVGSAGSYANYYLTREDNVGIEAAIGFHAGSWVYSEDGKYPFDPNIYTEEQVAADVLKDARSKYKLGETFYIVGTGPAFGVQIKIEDIQVAYSTDFKRLFDRG